MGVVFHRILFAFAWEIDIGTDGFRYCCTSNVLELLRLFYTVGIPPLLTAFLNSFSEYPFSPFELNFILQDGWSLDSQYVIRGDSEVTYSVDEIVRLLDSDTNPKLWLHLQDAITKSLDLLMQILENQIKGLARESDHWPDHHLSLIHI